MPRPAAARFRWIANRKLRRTACACGGRVRRARAAGCRAAACLTAGVHQATFIKLHPGDQLLHPLVDRAERVLAQHSPLCLVVELEMDPVDGEVTAPLLSPSDEVAAQ